MTELFESIFEAVMEELNLSAWWELADGEGFTLVEERVAEALGISEAYESEAFCEWASELAAEL